MVENGQDRESKFKKKNKTKNIRENDYFNLFKPSSRRKMKRRVDLKNCESSGSGFKTFFQSLNLNQIPGDEPIRGNIKTIRC